MKRKSIVITTSLAMLLGLGIAGGLSVNRAVKSSRVVKADTSTVLGDSGKIFLQLNTNEWKSSSSKIGLYMFNNSVSKSAWGGYVTPSGTSRYVEYSYDLDFTPNQCIAFRVSSDAPAMGQWLFDDNRSDSRIYSTTNDTTFDNVVWLGNYYTDSKWTESGAYDINAVVKGGNADEWSVATVDAALTNVKVNGSDKLEVYGEVALPANTYFKVVKGGSKWCGAYTFHSSISNNLSGGGESNIHNTAAATYEFYFVYNDETVYITDPAMAAADEWAQYFLNHVGCDANGVNLPSGWSACANEYAKLSGDAKDIVYGTTGNESGNYLEQAVARYDYAVAHHAGLSRFIVNSSDTPRAARYVPASQLTSAVENNGLLIIGIVSLVATSAVAGYFLLRKKKQK